MARRVDIRIDAQGNVHARLPLARDCVDPLDLSRGLRVDAADAEVDRLRELRRRLPDAGEHNLRRDEPRAQRYVDLAAGVRVGIAAETAPQPCYREPPVRFERIVNGVRA